MTLPFRILRLAGVMNFTRSQQIGVLVLLILLVALAVYRFAD